MIREWNYLRRITAFILISLFVCVGAAGCNFEMDNVFLDMERKQKSEAPADMAGFMEVHFLDVGQADSILIKSGEAAMLVDAGNNGDAGIIIDYLEEQGISELDYVIGTHPHEDHIGSLDSVISHFDIGEIIMPEKTHTTRTFEDVLTAIADKGMSITLPRPGDIYELGTARFTIIAPNGDYRDNLNDWSVGIRLVNGDNSFVFCGDAERSAEEDMNSNGLLLSADVYKVNHHGSKTSNTEEFLGAVDPAYAVISCGKENSYGLPSIEVLERLKSRGVQVFRTDEQGTVVASSDGSQISWNVQPSTSMRPGKRAR